MTDLSRHALTLPVARARGVGWRAPLLPFAIVLVAAAAGFYAGRARGGDSADYEASLLLLLRFMAAMKFTAVVLAAALTHWRFRSPITPPLPAIYLGALAVMAAASGAIWSLGGIVAGAVLFHIGLLAFLVAAWKDDGVRLPSRR